MDISVIVCTWNRASFLDQCLSELASLVVPDGISWEVLVIDNASSDSTSTVIAKHAKRLPLRCVFEPVVGHAYARNRAIQESRGDLLLWTDDDFRVEPNWLNGFYLASLRWTEYQIFAGPIRPQFVSPPPLWLRRHLAKVRLPYAVADYGDEVRPLKEQEFLLGANFATKREVFANLSFDPSKGRCGGKIRLGEDLDFVRRARSLALKVLWVGNARVVHVIPRKRMHTRYVRNWYFELGYNTELKTGSVRIKRQIKMRPKLFVLNVLERLLRPTHSALWLSILVRHSFLRGLVTKLTDTRMGNAIA